MRYVSYVNCYFQPTRNACKQITSWLYCDRFINFHLGQSFFSVNINANAETIVDLPLVFAMEGLSDKVEGKVEEDIGTVERNIGKITGQAEGALK